MAAKNQSLAPHAHWRIGNGPFPFHMPSRTLPPTAPDPALPVSMRQLLTHERPLLLQGPMGPFFDHLARYLAAHGQVVRKVHFNGGDEQGFGACEAERYTAPPERFATWLRTHLDQHRIDALVLFGQMRPLHRVARALAHARRLPVYVFEEGYFRPDYVTLEVGGVNAESSLPRQAPYYAAIGDDTTTAVRPTHTAFRRAAWLATRYAVASATAHGRYPHYRHHRDLGAGEAARWIWSGARKLAQDWSERGRAERLCAADRSKRWYLVPLQVHNDAQVTCHSRFGSMEPFIATVMRSFARHAPGDVQLVLKHHPMDRACREYGPMIERLAEELNIASRVVVLHDAHLPTLLRHARGLVTLNSTTALQALHHHCPVATLADGFYNIPGLVHTGSLKAFWAAPGTVDEALFRRFRAHVIRHTQLNASFYGEAPALRLPSRGIAPSRAVGAVGSVPVLSRLKPGSRFVLQTAAATLLACGAALAFAGVVATLG